MTENNLISWLLDSDVSIQYQVHRDLLDTNRPDLKERIGKEGWGTRFLSCRGKNGHWGLGFYQPKWTSSHYTLLDLKNLEIPNEQADIKYTINKIIREDTGPDGGINPARSLSKSDVCINGMFLNYATYFGTGEAGLRSIVDFILSQQLPDGGFNCQFNRKGARHSSLHSTLSVIEGFREYAQQGYTYRLKEIRCAELESQQFILRHHVFRSHRTGAIIDKRMLMLSFPSRWRYDILRALDYFRVAGSEYDPRMNDALNIVLKKRKADGKWPLQCRHSGQSHFEMETPGQAGRWNTLRALRVLKYFGMGHDQAAFPTAEQG
jgi:hypothetical protein